MLEFVENLQKAIRDLKRETIELVASNRVKDMEQYRFLMGRLEGYEFVEQELKRLLGNNPEL
jgi:hypothetical protein